MESPTNSLHFTLIELSLEKEVDYVAKNLELRNPSIS